MKLVCVPFNFSRPALETTLECTEDIFTFEMINVILFKVYETKSQNMSNMTIAFSYLLNFFFFL